MLQVSLYLREREIQREKKRDRESGIGGGKEGKAEKGRGNVTLLMRSVEGRTTTAQGK